MLGDVGRVQRKAGTRAALDGLKIAEGPRDVSRIARLAESKGTQTRAILRLFGRGAIWLTAGAFNLFSWGFGRDADAVRLLLGLQECGRTRHRALSRTPQALRTTLGFALRRAYRLTHNAARAHTASSMQRFQHDGVEIAFLDEGEGEPIVLVHGFASNADVNWVGTGWVATLTQSRPPRHRARQSRAWRLEQALRSCRLSQQPDGRRRARAARSSRSAARRHHGLFDGRAHHRVPGARTSRFRAQRHFRRPRHPSGRGRRAAAGDRGCHGGAQRSTTSKIPSAACSAPLPTRPNPIGRRSRPASAARGRR